MVHRRDQSKGTVCIDKIKKVTFNNKHYCTLTPNLFAPGFALMTNAAAFSKAMVNV